MALSNFGELKTAIATLLDRSDLTDNIPDFVSMLEATINRDVLFRNRRMETTADLTFTGDEATLPTDFIEARTLVWKSTPRVRLTYLSPSDFENTYTTDTPGLPSNFTIYGNTVKVGQYPNSAVGAEMTYYQRLTSLSGDSDTNWLLTYHPDVYLYGSAVHSAPFLGADERLQTWLGLYQNAAAQIAGDDTKARFNGAPIRQTINVRNIV